MGSDDADESDDVSPTLPCVGVFIESLDSAVSQSTATSSDSDSPKETSVMTHTDPSPIMIPHLFWRALASPPNALPIMFDCLLDNGSHLILIRDSLVTELQLCRRNLPLPIETELAMHADDKKTSVTLHKYVNLSLYDASGEYSARTV